VPVATQLRAHLSVLPVGVPDRGRLWGCFCLGEPCLAQPVLYGVPDVNPPAASTLGVPCIADFSAPVAAANLLGFWDSQNHGPYGHWNAGGVTGGPLQPYPGSEVAQYLSWFMATNSRRNAACATVASDTWGRANARTGATAGTRQSDIVPGIVEYVRWDAAFHPFAGGISQPPLPARKAGYDWRLKTYLAPSFPPDVRQFVYDATRYFPFAPLLATFQHWHLTFLCAENGIEYYDWLPPVSGTDDPAFAPNYSGGGTPPAEQWNGDNLGHAVVVVDALQRSACSSPPRDWFVVHDGIPNTGTNVAVPFFYDEAFDFKTWLTSYSGVEDVVIEPDLAIDAAGHRHVVWGGGPMNTPEQQIFYAGNAASGALEGTFVDYGKDPAIAIDPNNGHATVAFIEGFYRVRSTTNQFGYWSSEDVSTSSPPISRSPAIAIDSLSNSHVIWQAGCDEVDGCPWVDVRLYWSDKPAGGSWGTTQPLYDIDDPDVSPEMIAPNFDPDLAVHGADAYLVYDHGHEEIKLLSGTIIAGEITWDPGSLQTVNVATGHPVGAPKIAVDDDGDVYVVWSDQRSGVWQTYHQARRAGSWLAADLVLSTASTSATEPDLALRNTPSGTYVDVVWEEELPAGNYEVVTGSLFAAASGDLSYPGAVTNRSATAAPSRSPALAYNPVADTVDLAWADDSVRLLPEAGLAGLLAGIAALAALRRDRRTR
jgi:hypothetical protein